MPTYEYRCPKGHDFERFVLKMSDASSSLPCPTCGAEAARQISAGGGLVFKGSGFYITDYGKDGKKDERAKSERAAKGDERGAKGDDAKKSDAPVASSSGESGGTKAEKSAPSTKPEKTEKRESSAAPAASKPDKPSSSGGTT